MCRQWKVEFVDANGNTREVERCFTRRGARRRARHYARHLWSGLVVMRVEHTGDEEVAAG